MIVLRKIQTIVAIVASLSVMAGARAWASDLAKEGRWAEQVVDGLVVGDAVWLKGGGQRFLALYTEATTGRARGAAIILHGMGVHPDWPEVIAPLRTELPDHRWATLSIQMPVLPNEAKIGDYAPLFIEVPPRVDAAVRFLRERGYRRIALIGHSLGSLMGASYLASGAAWAAQIDTFVAIGMSVPKNVDARMNPLVSLAKIHLPLLDLYGEADLDRVRHTAVQRRQAARRGGNLRYRQEEVAGAGHFFKGHAPELVHRVLTWLDTSRPTPATGS